MKKNYISPELTALLLEAEDVITSSSVLDSLGAIIAGDNASDPAMSDDIE
ncbi:MAG: hypothetical protein J6A83_04200 [Clostridia bacterium]|nr:hypothetical protein [Clostridia bacterium]